jgi:methyl-accepting chemotaxis protein
MNIQSITAKAWLFTTIFAILLGMQFIVQYLAQAQLKDDLSLLHTQKINLMHHAYALKEVTGKVHQELVKISAIREQDSLNEGFELADKYTATFTETVDKLNNLNPENTRQYQSLLATFKEYIKTGVVMAEAYIEQGPDSGNPLMETFDQDATKINKLINKLVEKTVREVDESLKLTLREADTDVNLLIIFSSLLIVLLASLIIANKLVLSYTLAILAQIFY